MNELCSLREKINEADAKILELFEKRMALAKDIALVKKSAGLPILNAEREKEVIERISALTESEALKPYSERLFISLMELSKEYQRDVTDPSDITVRSQGGAYPIYVGSSLIRNIDKIISVKSKAAVITDSGVPSEYSALVSEALGGAAIFTVPEGEACKTLDTYSDLCKRLLEYGLSRGGAIIAVGGGAVGDLAAFVAATYMRGVDFYNIPTTLLSMVDSSVGGKCGVNLGATKNILGAFYPPRAVVIDIDLLASLTKRELLSGIAEIVKIAAISDEKFFALLEANATELPLCDVIRSAVLIKKNMVEADEKEGGLRKILNFGHTVGHGIESLGARRHGECVALGMLPFSSGEARERISALLSSLGLSTSFEGIDRERALEFIKSDKKGDGEYFDCVFTEKIGECEIRRISFAELQRIFREYGD